MKNEQQSAVISHVADMVREGSGFANHGSDLGQGLMVLLDRLSRHSSRRAEALKMSEKAQESD